MNDTEITAPANDDYASCEGCGGDDDGSPVLGTSNMTELQELISHIIERDKVDVCVTRIFGCLGILGQSATFGRWDQEPNPCRSVYIFQNNATICKVQHLGPLFTQNEI